MNLVRLFHDGAGYGAVWTAVPPNIVVIGVPGIRLRDLELEQLAMLAADLDSHQIATR